MHHTEIKIGSQWVDANHNAIQVTAVANHSGNGFRVHAHDLTAEHPCPHTFPVSMFEGQRNRRQTGFQRL